MNDGLPEPDVRALPGWTPPAPVGPVTLTGRTCRLEPLGPEHAEALFEELVQRSGDRLWDFLPYGPFADDATGRSAFGEHLERLRTGSGVVPLALLDAGGRARGVATYLRDAPAAGSVEVGHLAFSDGLQRTTAATEAMALMMRHVFERGYRRYEWKCNAANQPSRAAALRLGFVFEGRFRRHQVVKGRNRDTDWFAVVEDDWPRLSAAYDAWLAPANFDDAGRQRVSLSGLTGP